MLFDLKLVATLIVPLNTKTKSQINKHKNWPLN